MSHTPAPWKWWTSNSWKRLKAEGPRGATAVNVLEPYVCPDGHPDVSITEDDMALIAAAPELLEALKETRKIAMPPEITDLVYAAIAKAEGR